MKILITGSRGFIGRNLIERLKDEHCIVEFVRGNTLDELKESVRNSDFIYHLAGCNRTNNEKDFEDVNVGLTRVIVEELEEMNKKSPIVFPSSIQAIIDNPYGRSKKAAEDLLIDYKNRTGAIVYLYRLTHVFGRWAPPNYNSVVATWMYNAMNGKCLSVWDENRVIELLHIDDVVKEFYKLLSGEIKIRETFLEVKPTFKINLLLLAKIIELLCITYADNQRGWKNE